MLPISTILQSDRFKAYVKTVLKITITGLLLWFISSKIDIRLLGLFLLKSNKTFILFAFLSYYASIIVGSARNLTIIRSIGYNLKAFGFFKLYAVGLLYNLIIPGGIGGDGYKIYILKKKKETPIKKLVLSMLFDRISGLWALAFLSTILIIMIPKLEIVKIYCTLGFIFMSFAYYYSMKKFFLEYFKKFTSIHFKAFIVQLLQLITVVFILLSQNFDGKYSPYLFSFLLSTLAAVLPISLAGLGTREYVMLSTSTFFNINSSLAIFITVAFFFISTITAFTGLFFINQPQKELD